jgi:hypothetical protein
VVERAVDHGLGLLGAAPERGRLLEIAAMGLGAGRRRITKALDELGAKRAPRPERPWCGVRSPACGWCTSQGRGR